MPRMHAGEVETDAALVRQLLAAQFPQWAGLPVLPVPSAGTDNALYLSLIHISPTGTGCGAWG